MLTKEQLEDVNPKRPVDSIEGIARMAIILFRKAALKLDFPRYARICKTLRWLNL